IVRKLLWRIRRKLIISYIFIGLTPIVLLAILILLGTYIFMGQSTSEMATQTFSIATHQARAEGFKLLQLFQMDKENAVDHWLSGLSDEERPIAELSEITLFEKGKLSVLRGPENATIPDWVHDKEWAGIVLRNSVLWLTAICRDPSGDRMLLLQIPIQKPFLNWMQKDLKTDVEYFTLGDKGVKKEFETVSGTSRFGSDRQQPIWPVWWDFPIAWLNFPEQRDWITGKDITVFNNAMEKGSEHKQSVFKLHDKENDVTVESGGTGLGAFLVTTNISRVYNRIFASSSALQRMAYGLMVGIAIFFLCIELIFLISGFFLAKSITSSIHSLFVGTEHIRAGDLDYRIKVKSKDQLGDLATRFNQMTDSIKGLLVERTEKERLAESLQIARQMQEKLLPTDVEPFGNLEIAAMNLAAQEVCGDYYDIIRDDGNKLGLIIADVSGKGPSAALYMAEVKGVILSIGRRTIAPKEVLLEAGRILTPTLDSRTFITMTFASLDRSGRSLRLARAGHNPSLHYSAKTSTVQVVQPAGVGLGVGRNGLFESALEEIEIPLDPGDVLVFYTDGLTEAMNQRNELYGLPRLESLLLKTSEGSASQIKDAIYADLQQFLNATLPQDDITLVLIKVLA
ncbi:MAG TPA: PP2C family protein-serine/threonine phosphatase, partial [Acidobacteriota bacterium]|nr:PP2C family protein-serine/threonine phosphatase [Acidobacteriota bacterium]